MAKRKQVRNKNWWAGYSAGYSAAAAGQPFVPTSWNQGWAAAMAYRDELKTIESASVTPLASEVGRKNMKSN
jgi:hypothetical protein